MPAITRDASNNMRCQRSLMMPATRRDISNYTRRERVMPAKHMTSEFSLQEISFLTYIYRPVSLQSIPTGSDLNLSNSEYRSVRSVQSFQMSVPDRSIILKDSDPKTDRNDLGGLCRSVRPVTDPITVPY